MFIVSYDFANDRKRARFSKFFKQFGEKIQYSVYQIKNSPRILKLVLAEVKEKYAKDFDNTDNVLIFQICDGCMKKIRRYGNAVHEEESVVYLS